MIKAILLFFYLMFSQFVNAQNSEQVTDMIGSYHFETQSHASGTFATLSGMALKAAITSLKQGAHLSDTTKYPLTTSLKMGAYLTDTTKFKLVSDSVTPGGWASNYDVSLKQNLLSFVPPKVYQNQTVSSSPIIWCAQATTTNGVATFNPTSDNTGSGTALFTHIYSVVCIAENNTAVFTSMPLAAVKAIASDKKSLTVNVGTGAILGILGATILSAANGTNVHITIIGD